MEKSRENVQNNMGSIKSMKESNLVIMQKIKDNLTREKGQNYNGIQKTQNGLKGLLDYITDHGFDSHCKDEAAKLIQNRKFPEQDEDPPHIQEKKLRLQKL